MEKEIQFLKSAVDTPTRPFAAIVGGAKVRLGIYVHGLHMSLYNYDDITKHSQYRIGGSLVMNDTLLRQCPLYFAIHNYAHVHDV